MNYTFFRIKFMTGIIFLTAMLMLVVASTPAIATEGFTQAKSGMYEYMVRGNEMIVNTLEPMTIRKSDVVRNKGDLKLALPKAQTIWHKIYDRDDEISNVVIGIRQMRIYSHPFPGILKQKQVEHILSVLDEYLKPTKKLREQEE